MPKLVDHAERRRAILEVTWRLIATQGPDAATMREIARQAGYANGALVHYFPNKEALIEAAYVYVSEQTDLRIRAAASGKRGLAALRAFLVELVPTKEVTLLEARIVLPFWSRTVTDGALARTSDARMQRWRDDMVVLLAEARRDGEVRTAVPDAVIAEQLLAMAMGMQVLAQLPDHATTPDLQLRVIEAHLAALA
ncbi:TetR/AcrR family transcriptional regulator [Umezawaea tangerina]|uniref:TetR family transcriptional regulator n=1 Tax=Umezawaea tangerina TaxID=84725 RepID=A0A2T0T6H0_9PSEU|nr:TetR/AcrR family transcriptional regulator [Umezawaea tangerina]PRY41256.1 TetR family transcriptional regulator [Umezawaea tangerina]